MKHNKNTTNHWLSMNQTGQAALHSLALAQSKNPDLKAFTCLASTQEVLEQSKLAESLPLQGLPVGIKDIIDAADFPTEYGSVIHTGFRPKSDAAIVSLLKRAGAVIIGKTVSTEFAFLEPAATLNPHRQLAGYTPGGSSAGSAAAVAAGILPFAVGTQTGGSVIRPASYCGVVGFKPSFGVLPMPGIHVFSWSLDTLGFFAPDVALMQHCLSALHSHFATQTRAPSVLKLGMLRQYPWDEQQAEATLAVDQFITQAQAAGHQCVDVRLPGSAAVAYQAHGIVQDYEVAQAMAWVFDHQADKLSPLLRNHLTAAQAITYDQYLLAQRQIQEARVDVAKIFDRADLIVLPSAPGAPPLNNSTGSSSFNRLWTALGYPCVSLPHWVNTSEGLRVPIGIQLVGRPGSDNELLKKALELESIG